MLTLTRTSHAQLRWDVGARIGAGKRFLSSQPSGAGNAESGPAAELSLHTALLPLLRVGPAISAEVSPGYHRSSRRHYGIGVEARLFAPLPWPKLRPFAYVGVRGVLAHQPESAMQASARGGYLSIPFGIGVSAYVVKKLRFVATFGADGAVAHGGTLYDKKSVQYVGNDSAGIRGMVGVDLEF